MSKNNGRKENYTQLPHRVLESLMQVNLSPLETRVVLTVIRWTYGFHREWCQLSYSRVSVLSGVSRQGVYKSIRRLVARGIIERRSLENRIGYEMRVAVSLMGDSPEGDSLMEVTFEGDGKSPQKEIVRSPGGETFESPAGEIYINKEIKVLKKVKQNGAIQKRFDRFWDTYPRKGKRRDALKAFKVLNPDDGLLEVILKDIELKKKTPHWLNSMKKDDGQFISLPGNYIRERRWEDEKVKVPLRMGESWND